VSEKIVKMKDGKVNTAYVKKEGKKKFVEPDLKEYPSLSQVTLLTVPGVSGSTFFKTFK